MPGGTAMSPAKRTTVSTISFSMVLAQSSTSMATPIVAHSKTGSWAAMERTSGRLGWSMRESSRKIMSQAGENSIGQMEAIIQEKFSRAREMASVSIPAQSIARVIRDFGKTASSKEKARSLFRIEQSMKGNSIKVSGREQAKSNTLQEISMRVSGFWIRSKEEEWWIGILVFRGMREIGATTCLQVAEPTFGLRAKMRLKIWRPSIRVAGRRASEKATAVFIITMDANWKAASKITWKKGWAYSQTSSASATSSISAETSLPSKRRSLKGNQRKPSGCPSWIPKWMRSIPKWMRWIPKWMRWIPKWMRYCKTTSPLRTYTRSFWI